jgi:hypothetical protein
MDRTASVLRRAWTPRGLILAIALPLGLFFVVAQPAWMGHDESVHFPRAWQIAGGDLTPQWRYLAPLLGPLLVALPRLPRIRASLGLPIVAMGAASSAVGYLMALS